MAAAQIDQVTGSALCRRRFNWYQSFGAIDNFATLTQRQLFTH